MLGLGHEENLTSMPTVFLLHGRARGRAVQRSVGPMKEKENRRGWEQSQKELKRMVTQEERH
jgi:hypothetical protein